jgi:hypothetical protein
MQARIQDLGLLLYVARAIATVRFSALDEPLYAAHVAAQTVSTLLTDAESAINGLLGLERSDSDVEEAEVRMLWATFGAADG